MFCPYCGKEVPHNITKERRLLLNDSFIAGYDLHCCHCGIDVEVENKTLIEKHAKEFYEKLSSEEPDRIYKHLLGGDK